MGNESPVGALIYRQHPSFLVAATRRLFIKGPQKCQSHLIRRPDTITRQWTPCHLRDWRHPGLRRPSTLCGMTVTLKADTLTESFSSKPFHICSDKCQTKFKDDP